MTRVAAAPTALLLSVALLLTGCDGSGANPDPTAEPTSSSPSAPDQHTSLDEATAAQLVIARYDAVHGLPPTPPDEVDVEAAADGVVAPGSTEAERVAGALSQAIELGVLDRGNVLVEALEPPAATSDETSTASLCMSQDLRTTDLETGEETGASAPPSDWLHIEATFERVAGAWLVAEITVAEPVDCVPPSLESELSNVWGAFTDAWRDWGRSGGDVPAEVLDLATDEYADILRDASPIEPDEDQPEFSGFDVSAASRTMATAQTCFLDQVQTVEWRLIDGRWLIDIVRQEDAPCG
jgi:hypothetical protein